MNALLKQYPKAIFTKSIPIFAQIAEHAPMFVPWRPFIRNKKTSTHNLQPPARRPAAFFNAFF
jgi:hypothetical protein